jgi:hypothetical protein
MLYFDTETKQIQINRGDSATLSITAKTSAGEDYTFSQGDTVKFKVTKQKNESAIVIEKTITLQSDTTTVDIALTSSDTKIGDYISKPITYWYEISIESPGGEAQTILGYDKDGAKEFILNPEAR